MRTSKICEVINITREVKRICGESGINNGFVLVFPLHTSSSVYISDSDPSLTSDFINILQKNVPSKIDYQHNKTDPKQNAHAHIQAILTGHHIVLPLTDGELDLGVYQTIYYAEFDGTREKDILVKIIGE